MGYTRVREYTGGMAEWMEKGLPLESGAPDAARKGVGTPPLSEQGSPAFRGAGAVGDRAAADENGSEAGGSVSSPGGLRRRAGPTVLSGSSRAMQVARRMQPVDLLDRLAGFSARGLLLTWLGMVLGLGLAYWLLGLAAGPALLAAGTPLPATGGGLLSAIYFSFVTATSVGFGDIVPAGFARVLAVTEAAAGLLIFGCLISRLLSRRQEHLIEEIHRTTFEERLGRVRVNLHLVVSELQANAAMCSDPAVPREKIRTRVESTVMVFAGELRTVHDLLYNPERVPEEAVLETILANLTATFGELRDLMACFPESDPWPGTLRSNLATIARLASEICGECVPRDYAPHLKGWMDRIQEHARGLTARPVKTNGVS